MKNKTITMKDIKTVVVPLILCLFFAVQVPVVFAGEIDGVVAKYYSASAAEDMSAYYSTLVVSGKAKDERQLRTRFLWDNFDTVSYELTDIVITEDGDSSIVEYALASVVSGLNEKGQKDTYSYTQKMVAVLTRDDSGQWKIYETMPASLFDARLSVLTQNVADTCEDCSVFKEKTFFEKIGDYLKKIIKSIITTITGNGVPDKITSVKKQDIPVVEKPVVPEPVVEKPVVTPPKPEPIVEKPIIPAPVVEKPIITPPKPEPVVVKPIIIPEPVVVIPPPVPIVVPEPIVAPSGTSGIVTLSVDPHEPFDFSIGRSTTDYYASDLVVNMFGDLMTTCDSEGLVCVTAKKETSLSYDQMTTPPTEGYMNGAEAPVATGDLFWIKTREGKYAKIEITNFTQYGQSISFKWTYFK